MPNNITKIKANSAPRSKPAEAENTKPVIKAPQSVKPAKSDKKPTKKSKNNDTTEKPLKSVFILARPFVALGRYLRDSWREIRQVRWPNRKATWKMTLAVLAYCAIFMAFILILDALFTFVFEKLLNTN